MPLFTFTCDTCHKTHELLVRNGEAPKCPSCGAQTMAQAMSHFAPVHSTSSASESACSMNQHCCGPGCGCAN